MKGKSSLFAGNYRGIAAGNISFMPTSGEKSKFAKNIANRPDIDPNGTFDVIAHGTWKSIEIRNGDKDIEVNARTAAKVIKRQKGFKEAKSIRLLSCSTGANPEGFAQHLANALGKPVYAPNKTIYSLPNGKHWIGSNAYRADGDFVEYKPGGVKHGRK